MKIYTLAQVYCKCGGWSDSIFGKCNRCGKTAILN